MIALLLAACAAPDDKGVPADAETGDTSDTSADTGPAGACPGGMVAVAGFCIDAFEATVTGELGEADAGETWPETTTTAAADSLEGVVPTTVLSWYQASAACRNAGKHLCTVREWQAACGSSVLPWGDEPPPHEVCALPAPDGTSAWTGLQPTGSLPDCRSPEGVFDQIGNAWEWADPETSGADGRPMTAKLGGAWYAGMGNALCTVAPFTEHPPEFAGTIAARCCSEMR